MYRGITLTQQVKDLYNKNFESEEKKLKTPQDGKTTHSFGLIVWKWPFYQKQSLDSIQLPSKYQHSSK